MKVLLQEVLDLAHERERTTQASMTACSARSLWYRSADRACRVEAKTLHSLFEVLAGENISARFVVPTVASATDVVVHLGLDLHGVRRVNEIVAVPGRVENDVIETEPLFVRSGDRLVRTSGMPSRLDNFARAGIDVHALLASPVEAVG